MKKERILTSLVLLGIAATPPPEMPSIFVPLAKKAQEIRLKRSQEIPYYNEIVDPELASEIAFTKLIWGCGLDHLPPQFEIMYICSNSLLVAKKDGTVIVISFTHDTRSIEAEAAAGTLGKKGGAKRLENAWLIGKEELSKKAFENMTGLPIDYVVKIEDVVIPDFINRVLGGKIKFNVPKGFVAQPIYVTPDLKLKEKEFKTGENEMDGNTFLQYIKAVVKMEKDPPPELENNARKSIAMKALMDETKSRATDIRFWLDIKNLYDFARVNIDNKAVTIDANLSVTDLLEIRPSMTWPKLGDSLIMADPAVTGNPSSQMRWATKNEPFAKIDIENGVYPSGYVEVPTGCNPYTGKPWQDCYSSVRKGYLGANPSLGTNDFFSHWWNWVFRIASL